MVKAALCEVIMPARNRTCPIKRDKHGYRALFLLKYNFLAAMFNDNIP